MSLFTLNLSLKDKLDDFKFFSYCPQKKTKQKNIRQIIEEYFFLMFSSMSGRNQIVFLSFSSMSGGN